MNRDANGDMDWHAVYGLFHKGRCIYVGHAFNTSARYGQHKKRFMALLGEMPKLKVLCYAPRYQIRAKETAAILRWRKKGQADYNKVPKIVTTFPAPGSQTETPQNMTAAGAGKFTAVKIESNSSQ